ncbi:anti-sigma factor family protein [Novipirellula artificiosorum]|uniref:Zinc-finger domain-containing protein n=1 Tax=Novipirellula artificiosorum TaxID=2528016 RepID=A0A5C6E3H9_9BACT|nr:zf-HC2 domain-containing protein [Novipirellula artificiosorum]TWU41986.1 hypothetical protein Poly41_02820 [Novipirellula artificiosorum]
MNCDDFMERLQQRIDDRLSIDEDVPLQRHAQRCDVCRGQLFAWQQITRVLPVVISPTRHPVVTFAQRLAVSVAMIAAAVMFAFFVMTSPPEPISFAKAATNPAKAQPAPLAASVRADRSTDAVRSEFNHSTLTSVSEPREVPSASRNPWLQTVQNRNWIEQTMPTVQSFGRGVAPLGRSLLRAVTILTTSGQGQPS